VKSVNDTLHYASGTNPNATQLTLNYDINEDGITDISFQSKNDPAVLYQIHGGKSYMSLEIEGNQAAIKKYNYGEQIDWSLETVRLTPEEGEQAEQSILNSNVNIQPNFEYGQTYYIGIFLSDEEGNVNNGWAKIKILNTDDQIIFEQYGYNPVQNEMIITGQ